MGNKQQAITKAGRLFFVLELEYRPGISTADVVATISRAGTEDTFERTWRCPHGVPTESQVRDMAAFVARLASEAAYVFCGAQKTLDGFDA